MTNDIEPFYGELGRRVEDFRRNRHMTQEQLGDALQPAVTRSSISNLETGKQRVLAHTLWQVAGVLGVPIQDLYASSPPKKDAATTSAAVHAELAEKLALPPGVFKSLTRKLARARTPR
ncbi:MAG: helix-turn-helix transcriptional regulator [Thermoanaerobaculia bacterium]